jgi:type I restriction enzyme S subunit
LTRLIDLSIVTPKYGASVPAISKDISLPRYIRITDLDDEGHLKEKEWASITVEDAKSYFLREGDLIFARTGATVGKTYLYHKRDGRCAFAGYLIKFSLNHDLVDPVFLFYYTHSKNYWRWLRSIQTEGVQPNVNAEQYSYMPVLIPPIKEQKKIASILSKLDEQIQKTDQIIEQTQRLKKGLMQKLLTKGIGHKFFCQTSIGEMPVEWKVSTIGSECKVGSGGTPSRRKPEYFEGNIPWVKTTELNYNVITSTDEKISDLALSESSAKIYPEGTLLIAMIGLEAEGTRGKCAMLGIDAAVNQACAAIQRSANIDLHFLFYYYQTLRDKIMTFAAGSKRQNLNLEIVKSIEIPLPSLVEQHEIVLMISTIDNLLQKRREQKDIIRNLKTGLMQNLLTGKIRVKI